MMVRESLVGGGVDVRAVVLTLVHCKNKIVILTKKTLSVEIHHPNKLYFVNLTQIHKSKVICLN